MKTLSRTLMASVLLALAPIGSQVSASAQTATITPAPLPAIGTVPDAASGEQKTHDASAIEELMYVVELSRLIGGGISQILQSTQSMAGLLTALRDTAHAQLVAMTGIKTIPYPNTPEDTAARNGGTTFREMVTAALAGGLTAPADIASAFSQFVTTYQLTKAFAYQTSDTFAEVILAYMAANGAVAASISEHSYLSANASMDRIDGYVTALAASADLKTSLDINTRVNIEVAQQLNEMLRNQAALTSLAGFYFMGTSGTHASIDNNLDFTRLKGMFK